MAKEAKAEKTVEALEKLRKDLLKQLKENQAYLADTKDKKSVEILTAYIGGIEKKLDNIDKALGTNVMQDNSAITDSVKKTEENTKKIVDSGKKRVAKEDSFYTTMVKTSKTIGKEIAEKREIQGNFTKYLAENRDLLQMVQKDKTGKMAERMMKEMAVSMKGTFSHGKYTVKELQTLIKKNVDLKTAIDDSSDVFYGIKKMMGDLKDGLLDRLEQTWGIGGFFTAEMREHWKSGFDEMKGVVSHHMKEIMAPIEILLGPLKAFIKVGMIAYKMLKNRKPTMVEKETAHWQTIMKHTFSKMNNTLGKIAGWNKSQFELDEDLAKEARRKNKKEKEDTPWVKIMAGIAGLVAGLIAGSVSGMLGGVQLHALAKVIPRVAKFFQTIGDFVKAKWFKGIEKIQGIVASITKVFPKLAKFFDAAGKIFKSFGGGFMKGLLAGFKYIAWPLTMVMTVIDFVKGFAKGFESEGGGMAGLIAGLGQGISEAIKGFLYVPIKLLGWLGDFVLDIFGVEVEGGVGQKLFDIVDGFFGFVVDWWSTLWNTVLSIVSWIPGVDLEDMKSTRGLNAREKKLSTETRDSIKSENGVITESSKTKTFKIDGKAVPEQEFLKEHIRQMEAYDKDKGLDDEGKRKLADQKARLAQIATVEPQKAVPERTGGVAGALEARANMDLRTAKAGAETVASTQAGTSKDVVDAINNSSSKVANSMQVTAPKSQNIPETSEEASLAWMGDAMTCIGGA